MTFKFECPSCKHMLTMEKPKGTALVCPLCRANIVVPEDALELVAEVPIGGASRPQSQRAESRVNAHFVYRYAEGYSVAQGLWNYGQILRMVAVIAALVLIFIGLVGARTLGAGSPMLAIVAAVFVGASLYSTGMFLCATAQMMKATMDTAVFNNTMLSEEEKIAALHLS